jgi:hypothetical protein
MIELIDTFNNTVISRHRTPQAAAKAEYRHGVMIRRCCGVNSYIPTTILNGLKQLNIHWHPNDGFYGRDA